MKLPLTPIRCLYRGVDLYGHKVGVVSGANRYTYAEFGERCERLAAGLQAEGVQPGDRVAFLSFNNNQLLEGYYGPPLIGAITMPLNVRLQAAELIAILNHAEARVLVFETDFTPHVEQLRAACPGIQRWISIDAPSPHADLTYEELLSRGRIDRPEILSFDEDEIAELFYTSGSTGTPKGVMLSHRTLYLHALAVGGTFNHDDTGVELHTIPLFHANGWGRPQTAAMNGLKQVMVRRFEPAHVLRLIQEERATAMSLVPTMANALLNCPDLGTLRHVQHAGDPHRRRGRCAGADRRIGGGIPLPRDGRLRTHRDLPRGHLRAHQGHRHLRRRGGPHHAHVDGRMADPRLRDPRRRSPDERRPARHAVHRRGSDPRRQRHGRLLQRARSHRAPS